MNTHLILDTNNLCHRAFHALGDLSHEGIRTGMVYGVLRDVLYLQDLYATDRVVFCFDRGRPKRLDDCADYKGRRRRGTEEEMDARAEVNVQIKRLRTKYLPAIGFRNVFSQAGYEADDVIASVCGDLPEGDGGIVVSTDGDLYQLLSADRVVIWNPRKRKPVTQASFTAERGIGPSMWPHVKAIAGCPSDNIAGVRGVGEKTAVKFLTGRLKSESKAFGRIVADDPLVERNLKLTRLPYPGVDRFALREDEVTPGRWERVARKLGMASLCDRASRARMKG